MRPRSPQVVHSDPGSGEVRGGAEKTRGGGGCHQE